MRRRPAEPPPARAALWSRRCALFGVACALLAVLGAHAGLRPVAAVSLLGLALGLAGASLLLAGAGAVAIWRTGRRGIGALLAGLALSALVLAGPGVVAARSWRLPAVNDISTDASDPPVFGGAARAVAAREGATHSGGTVAADATIQPLLVDAPPTEVFAAALKLVRARRWKVLASRPPGAAPATAGAIEAVARTFAMGFRDDVAIRVAAAPEGRTRIDMRSASRTGWRDLGTNAARIKAFLADLDDALNP